MSISISDIRAASSRLTAIKESSDGEIQLWIDEANDIVATFLAQDLELEVNVTKQITTLHPSFYLPKVLSGNVTLTDGISGISKDDVHFSDNGLSAYYKPLNYYYAKRSKELEPVNLSVTGTWGYAPSTEYILIHATNDLKEKYNRHIINESVHLSADVTNTATSITATDIDSAVILLNELESVFFDHFASTVYHTQADTHTPNAPAASELNSGLILLKDLIVVFNAHLGNSLCHKALDTTNKVYWTTDIPLIPRQIKRALIRIVQRLALRANEEDQYQMNSGYASETTGDGYSYSLSDGTLRNLLRPEEREMLWPFKNRGRLIV